ncbi:MAG: hypothetical protein EBR09_12810 [Proteobacteria bacterium]|nr:hypothetical protein [Pseudomonadota bacterium]
MDSLVITVILSLALVLLAAFLGLQLQKKQRILQREREALDQLKRNIFWARGGTIYARRGFMRMPGVQKEAAKGKVTNDNGDWVGLSRERVKRIQQDYFQRRRKQKPF